MSQTDPVNPKRPPCPACRSGHTVQTSDHFGERMFFCLDCEHSWTVHPGKLPPRLRTLAVSPSGDDRIPALHAHGVRQARRAGTLAARAAAARAVSVRLVVEFRARQEVFAYLRGLIDRSRAIKASVH